MALAVPLVVCAAMPALAQERATGAVDLAIAGPQEPADRLEVVIRELLTDLSVELRTRRAESIEPREVVIPPQVPEPALARVWISIGTAYATVYLVDAPWERVLVRHVPISGGVDEVAREQLGYIVYSSVEALLAGAQIGLTREHARQVFGVRPSTPPPTPAPPPDTSGVEPEVFIAYSLRLWAPGPELEHAPRIGVALLLGDGMPRPLIAVGVNLRATTATEADDMILELGGIDARFEAGAELQLAPDTTVQLAGGLLLDFTRVTPVPTATSGISPQPASDTLTPFLTLRASVMHRVWRAFAIGGGLSVDVDLTDTRYVVAAGDDETVVLDPWTVRPALFVGLGARL